LKEFVFKGLKGDIPPHLEQILVGMHTEHIQRLSDYLHDEPYPGKWLQRLAG